VAAIVIGAFASLGVAAALASEVTVHGTITYGGEALSNAPIEVVKVNAAGEGTGVLYTRTGAEGAYSAMVPPNGEYEVGLRTPAPTSGLEVGAGVGPVTITEETELDIPIPALAARSLTVKVIDSNNDPYAASVRYRTLEPSLECAANPQGARLCYGGSGLHLVSKADSEAIYQGFVGEKLELAAQRESAFQSLWARTAVLQEGTAVTLLPTSVPSIESEGAGSGLVGVSAPDGAAVTLNQVEPVAPPGLPEGTTTFPSGTAFEIHGLPAGGRAEATVFIVGEVNPTNVFEYEQGSYVNITSLAEGYGYSQILHLMDGGLGDSDHEANGTLNERVFPVALPSSPAPRLKALSLKNAPASGGTALVLSGKHLSGATSVRFGATAVERFEVLSDESIRVITPTATAGKVAVTVASFAAASNAKSFTFVGPGVAGVAPGAGPIAAGNVVTVTGEGFATATNATTLRFGKTPATDVSCASTTECTARVPRGQSGTIDVVALVGRLKSTKVPSDKYAYH